MFLAIMLSTQEVQTTVAQFAAKPGFAVFLDKPKGKMTVKYKLPYRPGMQLPIKPAFKTVAEVEVKLIGGIYTVYVEQKVFGNDRPKIDRLIESLETIPIEGVEIIKIK